MLKTSPKVDLSGFGTELFNCCMTYVKGVLGANGLKPFWMAYCEPLLLSLIHWWMTPLLSCSVLMMPALCWMS